MVSFKRGIRGGKIGPIRWASPVRPELGRGWTIKLLVRKKSGQIWPGPTWPARFFFTFKRLFGPTSPVFRAGWVVKFLARKNRVNFDPAWFWPSSLLTLPNPTRPALLPALRGIEKLVDGILKRGNRRTKN